MKFYKTMAANIAVRKRIVGHEQMPRKSYSNSRNEIVKAVKGYRRFISSNIRERLNINCIQNKV